MLKLMRFPQGTNHNRTLKRPVVADGEINTDAEVQRLFRRFWREQGCVVTHERKKVR
jgi:hypothetical protein